MVGRKSRSLNMKRLIVVLVFALISVEAKSFYGYDYRFLSFQYGNSYRLQRQFYNSFYLTYEEYSFNCTSGRFKGVSSRIDYLNSQDYEISLSFIKSIKYSRNRVLFPYLGLSPTFFNNNGEYGANLKPEIGCRLMIDLFEHVGLIAAASYGYNIPVLNESKFVSGRHDFSLKAGIGIDLRVFRKKVVAVF